MITTTILLFAVFAVLQVADAWTTLRILDLGGTERNPLLRRLFDKFGALPVLVITKAIAVALAWWLAGNEYGPQILGVVCVVYVIVVRNNVRVLNSLKANREI